MRPRFKPTVAAALLLALSLTPARAQDAKIGRQKAQVCTVCHGADGMSTQPDAPHLAGQPALYLTTQLKAFRSGDRPHEIMGMMAQTLSDDDIKNIAAWFASIRVEAHLPR